MSSVTGGGRVWLHFLRGGGLEDLRKKMKPVCRGAGLTGCRKKIWIEENDMNLLTAYSGAALFLFLAVGAIGLFGFLSVATWTGTQYAEREAYYKAEMLKKIAEIGGDHNPALEYLREQERIAEGKRIVGFRVGGLVNVGVGIGLMIMLHGLVRPAPVYLCGYIPLFIGIALLLYGYWLGPKVER
jgi:hypothetical protein